MSGPAVVRHKRDFRLACSKRSKRPQGKADIRHIACCQGYADKRDLGPGAKHHLVTSIQCGRPGLCGIVVFVSLDQERNHHVHIQEIFHGKSDSRARTLAEVSFGVPTAETMTPAPVRADRTSRDFCTGAPCKAACLRYAERLRFSRRAAARIARSSAVDVLKVSVAMGNTVRPRVTASSNGFEVGYRRESSKSQMPNPKCQIPNPKSQVPSTKYQGNRAQSF